MKKLLFILLFTPLTLFSQWRYNSNENPFSGKYKIAAVIGNGGEYPYNNAVIQISKYEGSEEITISVSDAGYSGCKNLFLYFKFNGDDKIYSSNFVSSNAKNNAWILNRMDDIKIFQLLEKLKKHNNLDVRVGSSCGANDYKFSLIGATKSINYVVGKNYFLKEKEKAVKRYNQQQKISAKEDSISKLNKIKKRRTDSILEKAKLTEYLKYKPIIDKYKDPKYQFYLTPSNKQVFYIGYPIQIFKKYYSPPSSLFVVDKSFYNSDFKKVVFIEKKGKVDFYIPKNLQRFRQVKRIKEQQ